MHLSHELKSNRYKYWLQNSEDNLIFFGKKNGAMAKAQGWRFLEAKAKGSHIPTLLNKLHKKITK